MTGFTLQATQHVHHYDAPFRISGHTIDRIAAVRLTLSDARTTGRAEAAGVYYNHDDCDHILAVLAEHKQALEACTDREELRHILPPGGARNAVDCAMWEHESLVAGRPVWRMAGLKRSEPLTTTFTLSANAPETLAADLARFPSTRAIKMKLDGDFETDRARVAAVRKACPNSWLGVDANQGYDASGLEPLISMLADAHVAILEQPVKRGSEADLEGLYSSIPIVADESILCLSELDEKSQYFNGVNIKLDKCGGLTEGLMIARRARELGLSVMVGNMGGSTLAAAPAFVLAQICDHVDLDGPWFLNDDPLASEIYRYGKIDISPGIWGAEESVCVD